MVMLLGSLVLMFVLMFFEWAWLLVKLKLVLIGFEVRMFDFFIEYVVRVVMIVLFGEV